MSEDAIMSEKDCRVFRDFISLNALYSAKAFLQCQEGNKTIHQINALHRVREICWAERMSSKTLGKKSASKGITTPLLDKQLSLAILSYREVQKFEVFLRSKEWPRQLLVERENLMRTSKMDTEVMQNSGNEDVLLPSLLKAYERFFGSSYQMRLLRYQNILDVRRRQE